MGTIAGPFIEIASLIPDVNQVLVRELAVRLDKSESMAIAGASIAQSPTGPVIGAPPSNPKYFKLAGETNNANSWQNAGYFQYSDNGTTLVTQIDNAGYIFNEQGSDIDFKIEGDTNTTLLYVDAGNDRIGLGTATPAVDIHFEGTNADVARFVVTGNKLSYVLRAYSNTAGNDPQLILEHGRGTEASPTTTESGDELGGIYFRGWNNDLDDWSLGATIIAFADGEWATGADTSDSPSKIEISTTPDGTSTPLERVTFRADSGAFWNVNNYDYDFKIEGSTDGSLFWLDAGNDAITIGSTTEIAKFGIDGNADEIQFAVQAHSSQTANIVTIEDSSGNDLAGFDERGVLFSDGGIDAGSVYIGENTGNISHTNATLNVGIGKEALDALTTGDQNVAVGALSGGALTTGFQNAAIGYLAMLSATSAKECTAIGWEALRVNNGNFNNGMGSGALRNCTSGIRNNGMGRGALYNLTEGNNNNGVGYNALRNVDTGAGNTGIGYQAGRDMTGSNSVLIGNSAGLNSTTSNVLVIDNSQRADAAEEITNAIVYGVMAAAPADQTMRINALTGIGVTALASTQLTVEGTIKLKEQADAEGDDASYGQIWVDTATPNLLYFTDDAGTDFIVAGVEAPVWKSYTATTQGLGGGATVYVAGYYEAPSAEADLDELGTTITMGSANISYAAHAFLVASGAGSASGGSGAITIVVSGTTINDQGTRATGQTETIVADITAMSTDEYFETSAKWLGQITYTLTVGATGHSAFAAKFNYGFAKYDDYGNRDFTVSDFEAVGYAGANDADFEVQLCKHSSAGWTYSAAAFVPGPSAIVTLSGDHSTDDQLLSGEHFAYKRDNLSTAVSGSGAEGILIRIVTTANNALEYVNVHVGAALH